jgi:hypothetical protein
MSLAPLALHLLVLLVTGTVAWMPFALRESSHQVAPAPRSRSSAPDLWVVESPRRGWLIDGGSRSAADLERLLRRQPPPRRVRYLPSDALPFARVSRSLRWLRDRTAAPVVLELPRGTP